ncbi:hypothetical protein ACFQ51_40305 [Streptomyces kaempferi]
MCLERDWSAVRLADLAALRGVQCWQLGDAIAVAAGQDDRQPRSVPVGDQVVACSLPADRRRVGWPSCP